MQKRNLNKLKEISFPLASILVALILGAIIMSAMGYDVGKAYSSLLKGAFGSKNSIDPVTFPNRFFRSLPIGLMIKFVPFHHQIHHLDSMFSQNRLKNRMSVICSYIGCHSGDMKDLPAFILDHDLRCQRTSINMV